MSISLSEFNGHIAQGTTFRGSSNGRIVKSFFQRSLGPDEVAVQVTHSGVCGTDLHYMLQDMVLGHEAVGIVSAVGSACTLFKPGDRVGWGYEHYSCGFCTPCLTNEECHCLNAGFYGASDFDQGSFSNIGVWKQKWLFHIPEGIKSEDAAPLMCGGASCFSPLIEHCRPIDRVGIVGMGGLGHLAIQFAAKMGCEVVVFSGSESKRTDALALGASAFYNIQDVSDFSTLGITKPIDRLIVAAASLMDVSQFYPVLARKAIIIPLTATKETLAVPYYDTLFTGVKIIPSMLATRFTQTKMLEFADRHHIRPIIEKFPMTEAGIGAAIEKLKNGQIRYRAVLSWDY
ncbi:chaperonin 10-like protein [Lentinula aff. detonsa]|uniref:Chaperonin 10-like protein n=1 Tax=Lentinula aff. detonsa TaxID=2804958 RepID=A0AA38KT94_9AGAR|nr:chaperonin 10-like protein [Lentinula aff. detonsa]